MYTAFYGLRELPFALSPDPKYLLLTPRHREALANLQYGIAARKSLTLLLGEAGTGKTTLVHAALRSDACRAARILHLANPMLTRSEFIEFLAGGFELSVRAQSSKTALLSELRQVLTTRRAAGVTTALVIDEAQVLSEELLEEVRLLSNIETETEKLLPVVLVGQPELAERLNAPGLRQLKQRVSLRCTLGLLDALETTAYIAGRLRIAGGEPAAIFGQRAITQVHVRAGGIPRTISVICDNALVSGFAQGVKPITAEIVTEVCDDLDLTPAMLGSVAAPGVTTPPGAPFAPVRPAVPAMAGDDRLFASFGRKRGFSFF
jgi:type II secretory pathway predicted ATPase ExeA